MTDPTPGSTVYSRNNGDSTENGNSDNSPLLTRSSSSSTLSTSRPRSYGTIAAAAHSSADASPACPRPLAPRTVAYAGPDDAATGPGRISSTEGSHQQAGITTISRSIGNTSFSESHKPNFDPDFDHDTDTDLEPDPVLYAGLDDEMPPQTAFLSGSNRRLAIAYCGLLLVAFTTSLEAQVTAPLAAFAVSSFQNHSLLSTVYVVQGVVNAVIKPPMAKMADVFGRFEAFLGAVILCVIGYIQMALSRNVQTFAAAQIMYSAGITGLQVLQQIFVADTSDLRHRALLSSLPDTPFLATIWIGPSIAAAILNTSSWRWGYAMWAILLPIAFLPLGGSLAVSAYQSRSFRQQRSRSCLGLSRPKTSDGDDEDVFPGLGQPGSSLHDIGRDNHPVENKTIAYLRKLSKDLDIVGILLLSAALSMVLLPLTLAGKVKGGWSNPFIIASIIIGLFLLILVFPAWEARSDWAPHPLVPPALLRSVTFCAGCGVCFFFFAVFYLSVQPYFYSYLLVAHNKSVTTAGRITQIFSFTSTIAAVSSSIAIRHIRRYKVFVVSGACVYLAGVSCMLMYRTADAGTARLVATQVAVGLGAGLMSVPTQIGIQASVSSTPRLVSAATAVYLTMGEAGIAVGAAISGALWGRLVPAKLVLYLPEESRQNATAIYSSVVVATSYEWGSPERLAIIRAYQESMTTLLTVAVAFCVPVLLLSLIMKDFKLDSDESKAPAHNVDGEDDEEEEGLLSRTTSQAESAASAHHRSESDERPLRTERAILLRNEDDD